MIIVHPKNPPDVSGHYLDIENLEPGKQIVPGDVVFVGTWYMRGSRPALGIVVARATEGDNDDITVMWNIDPRGPHSHTHAASIRAARTHNRVYNRSPRQ